MQALGGQRRQREKTSIEKNMTGIEIYMQALYRHHTTTVQGIALAGGSFQR